MSAWQRLPISTKWFCSWSWWEWHLFWKYIELGSLANCKLSGLTHSLFPWGVNAYHLRFFHSWTTELGTKDLVEVCYFSFLSRLFGIRQVTSSLSADRQFCFSSNENCFHVDKNLALQQSTQKLPAWEFISDYISCLSTGNSAALAPAVSAAPSCLDDQIALCLCRVSAVYVDLCTPALKVSVFIKDVHWFMSRKGTQACINKPSGISSFKIWISLTAWVKVSLGCFSSCLWMWLFGLLRQNIFSYCTCTAQL